MRCLFLLILVIFVQKNNLCEYSCRKFLHFIIVILYYLHCYSKDTSLNSVTYRFVQCGLRRQHARSGRVRLLPAKRVIIAKTLTESLLATARVTIHALTATATATHHLVSNFLLICYSSSFCG